MIGNVEILNNFYEYLLYTKLELFNTKFNKDAKANIKNRSNSSIIDEIASKLHPPYRNQDNYNIFTIDNSVGDHDDALSWDDKNNV